MKIKSIKSKVSSEASILSIRWLEIEEYQDKGEKWKGDQGMLKAIDKIKEGGLDI